MYKIIIAPDSFKGSLRNIRVADAMEKGIRNVFPQANILSIPLADGGEGSIDAILTSNKGKLVCCSGKDPLGNDIKTHYCILSNNTAIIEMAAASGLELIPKEDQNPLYTTSYGTGQLIKDALGKGCRKFIIAIGGSATCDGGAGMAQALGVKFYDHNNKEITKPISGNLLIKCKSFSLKNLPLTIHESDFLVASDVMNKLHGKKGAIHIYAPQKGANEETTLRLEENMKRFYQIVEKKLNITVTNLPGSGAAGGMGAGLKAFLNAKIKKGSDLILKLVHFEEKIKNADFIITGEGKIDIQTNYGKIIMGVLKIARKKKIPVYAITGQIEGNINKLYKMGLKKVVSLCKGGVKKEEAINNAYSLIKERTEQLCKSIEL